MFLGRRMRGNHKCVLGNRRVEDTEKCLFPCGLEAFA